ncbi:helix-turn-helix transcriptional regulator [Aromatoleum buckelii]|uniref:AlpA family phage regulatory protein n=1 Tax=Aromatoleum buckelii TaxID=200254 RepID=A0ABX1N6C2_9RHOO|nr:AlpA family phage regulatory protein [Aromatoleum buckelii]MCK0511939.1 AlpA family phage regulatory protein [Aromatoleum buckelii]
MEQVKAALRILRLKQVKDRTSLATSTIYELSKAGKFPRQINLGVANRVGWLESEVDAWIAERVSTSRGSKAAA